MQNHPQSREFQWNVLNLLKWATNYFKSRDIDSPRSTAEILLASALQMERIELYIRYDQPVTRNELSAFKALIIRRIKHEPVAYILGSKEFWSKELLVNQSVLIPRPETECLVETALCRISCGFPMKILELGTGSGAVSIALASERSDHRFYASDRSEEAIRIAVTNAKRHQLQHRICFFVGDWFQALKENSDSFDMIISNPPYIRTSDIPLLQPEISQYEPRVALDGGEDGLQWIRHIILNAHRFLKPGGEILLEIGHDQKESIQKIVEPLIWYERPDFSMDYSGIDRIVRIRKKAEG
ncbi:MAG: peptide chain release factor N(5)-glutamine methyltransferase [Deltaproteobacteria bacterium]|nr:peptide chain release factor N(5)-glutamine methyltransferase [Deltaproteobacteria bacterium]MBW1994335.1 peptide chain release factor N(5)-glutamine methyltransferase [Deltaproteobacteria bacterium]MBW2151447.1 peptide chain release factor N(5)-glutamine methyltransferase [Deltaproteobacteria bacterium]